MTPRMVRVRARLRGMDCAQWPCRRCDKAGRTSWRAREGWHLVRRAHRRRWIKLGSFILAVALIWIVPFIVFWVILP